MKKNYEIEELADMFADHADMLETHNKHVVEQFMENYPDSQVPENLENGFNLSNALLIMCLEIEKLKAQIQGHLRKEHPYE